MAGPALWGFGLASVALIGAGLWLKAGGELALPADPGAIPAPTDDRPAAPPGPPARGGEPEVDRTPDPAPGTLPVPPAKAPPPP